VRVVLSFDTRSTLFDRGNRVTANRLLASGVRVYVIPGTTHAKAVSVDGVWAYTGTANFDPLSLRRNRELGLALTGAAVSRIDAGLFLPAFRPDWELTAPLPVSPLDRLCALVAATVG
jgi:phosphatidylserine/phosphatidylglycerophosphate/cardiolipin synthase-like enzyme